MKIENRNYKLKLIVEIKNRKLNPSPSISCEARGKEIGTNKHKNHALRVRAVDCRSNQT